MNPLSASRRLTRVLAWSVAFFVVLGSVVGVVLIRASRNHVPPPSAPSAPRAVEKEEGPRTPRVWTIAIGIEQYADAAIPSCHGAVGDARAVADWSAKTAGWGAENILLLDDRGETRAGVRATSAPLDLVPTRANLDWAFKEWLAPRLRPDDMVVVFFAGQAVTLPTRPDDPPDAPARPFLLPSDARASQWDKTAWPLDEALDAIAATGRNPVLCWLDAGPEGRGRRVVEPSGDARPSADPLLRKLARWPGVSAWIAADGTPSVEASKVGTLSPFTTALLEALGTPAQPNNLHACLDRLRRDPALVAQGFRTLGGIDPGLTLWSSKVERQALAGRELILQRGHAGAISGLAFTADGSRLISGAEDSTVKVWSASDRRVLRAFSSHLVGVTGLALSPDGALLASGDGAGWLRVWDLVHDRELPPTPPRDRGIDRIAFLPEGRRFASLDMDGKAVLQNASAPSDSPQVFSIRATGLATASGPGPIALVVAESDGKLKVLGPDGAGLPVLDGPGGIVTSRRLATDGKIVAAGDDRANLAISTDQAGSPTALTFDQAIDDVALAPGSKWLVVGSGKKVHQIALDGKMPARSGVTFDLPAPTNRLAFSGDGRWLAACTTDGALLVWDVIDPEQPRAVALETSKGKTTTFAFAPDGRRLVSGDQDGGIRTWDLPDGHSRPAIAPRRGKVAGLSVSADARYLLQISQDRQAQVWDLAEGRGVDTLPGEWLAGLISPDGTRVYLASFEGEIKSLDRASGRPEGPALTAPAGRWPRFGRLALSGDGRWLAAGSADGPLACVWDTQTGTLRRSIRGHQEPHALTAVGFADGGKILLTASEDGAAKLWAWDEPGEEIRAVGSYTLKDEQTGDPVPITAAQVSPGAPRRILVGGIDGRLALWEEGHEKPRDLGTLERSVLAATFTPDGRWLAVSGADKAVWLWALDRPGQRLRFEPTPQHAEQVNALVAWPDGRLIASGSDDTTIRLWNLTERSLLGTLSAEQGTPDWVAYTPDGLFDSSNGGEAQVSWRVGREVLSLEQVYDRFHVFRLTDPLRRGLAPKAPEPPRATPPRIAIEPPSPAIREQRQAELSIALGEPGLANVRLYQDGVPVQAGPDLNASDPRTLRARVRLRKGLNRFYVMAGRPDSTEVEGRSENVEVRYDGPDAPGQLHILSVGVSTYDNPARCLQFADRDAAQLADFLHQRGLHPEDTQPGLKLLLTNRDVTEEKVDAAFITIRDRVRDHPEDTVVVFLAGHADALNERFYLLLPPFPFPQESPGVRRAPIVTELAANAVLPYVALYRNISRLGALQRLIVIDACQAEAIVDDPGVRQIQELIDRGAQHARTAYLLGARRGEPAGEASALTHGLMTYALLKGLGDPDLEAVPGLTLFDELGNADRNRDGLVTTDELRWYTDESVPKLARQFPLLVQRSGVDGKAGEFRPTANLGQAPRIEGASASFPLVELPGKASGPASRD